MYLPIIYWFCKGNGEVELYLGPGKTGRKALTGALFPTGIFTNLKLFICELLEVVLLLEMLLLESTFSFEDFLLFLGPLSSCTAVRIK